jgi:L-ribulose-5-phosphate 3-epimerase
MLPQLHARSKVQDARKILNEHNLRVTDIASPLFKTDWPGGAAIIPERKHAISSTPTSTPAPRISCSNDASRFAKSFNTDRIRCFDYWRLDDPKPYRGAINAKLQQAAERCAKNNHCLVAGERNVLQHGNWRRGCRRASGDSQPEFHVELGSRQCGCHWKRRLIQAGYQSLPKDRIGHCHCKDVVRKPDKKYDWAPVGGGTVDWVGQLQALKRDGFHYGLSLETHWRGAGYAGSLHSH